MGWCGLKYTSDLKEYDLGFRFAQRHWNQGYAAESGIACLNYGFDQLKMDSTIGRVLEENLASRRVLEKVGMTMEVQYEFQAKSGLKCRLDKTNR